MYRKYFHLYLKKQFQYRLSTLFMVLAQAFLALGEAAAMILLMQQFKVLQDYSSYHIFFTYGVVMVSLPLAQGIFRGFDNFSVLVKTGDLDRFFIRPQSIFAQTLYSDFDFNKIGRVIVGIILSVIGLVKLNITWNAVTVFVILSMYVCGFIVAASIYIINAGITIFTIEGTEFLNIFSDGAKEAGQYPVDVYGKWFTRFFTFVIPLACFNYLPLRYICNMGGATFWTNAMAPIYGSLFIIPAILIFNASIKKYNSTGT